MSNESKRMMDTAALMASLASFGLLDELDSLAERYTPTTRPERSAEDVEERISKQQAKLARRAQRAKGKLDGSA